MHSGFSSHGNATWSCVSHMTWDVDVSQCTFVKEEDGEEKEFTLFLYQVPLEEETINSNFTKTVLEENVSFIARKSSFTLWMVVCVF